jgi:hypothetical protein
MITIGKQLEKLPKVQIDPELNAGAFYVVTGQGANAESQLTAGQEVVLVTEGGSAELTTRAAPPGGKKPTTEGTYVSKEDRNSLGETAGDPEVRLYDKKHDGWKKAKSASAVLLLITTGLGLASLAFGLWLAIGGEDGTSTAAIAERSETLLAWVVEPLDSKGGAEQVRQRSQQAADCLTSLRGGEAEVEKVGGVSCKVSKPPFWKNNDMGGLVGAAIGLIVAVLGAFGVLQKFSFRKTPAS